MELSIVHNIDLVKALNELKSLNTYTACVHNNILRIIESCFFPVDTGKKRWILPATPYIFGPFSEQEEMGFRSVGNKSSSIRY